MDLIKNEMNIDVFELEKNYDDFKLTVNEFHLLDSEIIGLIGNNGAGKTTFLRILLDLIVPDNGKLFSNGNTITLSDHWKAYTGSFLDEDFLIQFLTPKEFFRLIGRIYSISDQTMEKRLNPYLDFLNFDLDKKKYIREYSTGNKYKIGIVSSLIIYPKILILDEPFNFLDPKSQNQLVNILKKFNQTEESSILFSSHDLTHVTELCKRIILIENGMFIKDIHNEDQEKTYNELRNYFSII